MRLPAVNSPDSYQDRLFANTQNDFDLQGLRGRGLGGGYAATRPPIIIVNVLSF